MERRKFLKSAGLAGVLASGTAPAVVMAQQNIRWRLASSFPKVLDVIYGASEAFAKNVSEATDGKFQISVHAAGELVPAFSVADAVEQGAIECAHTAPYYFFGKDETFALDAAVPFGLTSRQQTAWMYDGNGMKLMREFYAQFNIVNFPLGNTGTQMGGWYRKELTSVADLNGLKFRVGGFAGRVTAKMGMVPQNIPGGEIYQALERGAIDAVEWSGPYDDLKLGFHKVAPYYYYPAWWEGGTQLSLYVNDKAYNALPSQYKSILRQAASDAHVLMQAMCDARNPKALRQLVAEGAKLHRLPRDIMDAAYKARNEVFAELKKSNSNWRKIYADYERFLRDQVQWFALAENSYSQFMAAQQL